VLEKLPPDSPYVGPALAMWMENIEGAGLKPLKDFNRRLMIQQGLIEAETDEEIQQVEQTRNQPDPNDELVKAATNQQNSESRNLDAASRNKDADTDKKRAETAEIVVDIGIKRNENSLRRLVSQA
jgi:hypothetical protein